jgi:hypothetical protein
MRDAGGIGLRLISVRGLVGALALVCAACIATQGEKDRGARTDCITCHRPEYEGAGQHVGKKPVTCGVCHDETSWGRAKRDHRWPLTGAHAKADCFACHSGNAKHYRTTSTACIACHRAAADPPPFPAHAHFPPTCEKCHSTQAWQPPLDEREKATTPPSSSAQAAPPVSGVPSPSPSSRGPG